MSRYWPAFSEKWLFNSAALHVEIHLFQLSLKSSKGSVEHPFPDVIRVNLNHLNNFYKKGLTSQKKFSKY